MEVVAVVTNICFRYRHDVHVNAERLNPSNCIDCPIGILHVDAIVLAKAKVAPAKAKVLHFFFRACRPDHAAVMPLKQ